jgi:hypothetical protein
MGKENHIKDGYVKENTMIKLKDILNEIIEPERMKGSWTTVKGAPDELINFIHELVAELMRSVGEGWSQWLIVKRSTKSADWYIINNSNNVILIYSDKEKKWFYNTPIDSKVKPISDDKLKIFIQHWVS